MTSGICLGNEVNHLRAMRWGSALYIGGVLNEVSMSVLIVPESLADRVISWYCNLFGNRCEVIRLNTVIGIHK